MQTITERIFGNVLPVFVSIVLVAGAWPAAGGEPVDVEGMQESVAAVVSGLGDGAKELPEATLPGTRTIDAMIPEITDSLEFASEALSRNELNLAADSLSLAKGMIEVALKELPASASSGLSGLPDTVSGGGLSEEMVAVGLTAADMENVKAVVERMAAVEVVGIDDVGGVLSRLEKSGFDVNALSQSLERNGVEVDDVVAGISLGNADLESISSALGDIVASGGQIRDFSHQLGQFARNFDLQTVADNVAAAIGAGADIDLESMAQGMGFDSFAAAVDAYNAAHGTNYSASEAAAALGQ